MTDSFVIFSLPYIFPVLVAFTVTEHASARAKKTKQTKQKQQQKKKKKKKKKKNQCNLYSDFTAFINGFNQNYIYLMFKSIISRTLTEVFDKYENIRNEKCLV